MGTADVFEVLHTAIIVAAKISVPILILSMLVGIFISIIQAATQIHEQTITFVPKLIVIALILVAGGGFMLDTLKDFTYHVFSLMLK